MLRSVAGWRRLSLAALLVIVFFFPFSTHTTLRGQASPRLATVLQDLSRTIPQEASLAPEAAATRALGAARLPKSVQDAMQARRLRVDDQTGVQVYLLLSEVTDDALNGLRAAGVTVEIPDAEHHRVQARVPPGRLEVVASLPGVNFIRLPNYAVHRVGSVTTEGDAILHADQARAKYGVDGSGVKVGVLSDGIKGVFPKGCTSCSAATAGPVASGDLPDATGVRTPAGVLTSSTGGILGKSFQANSDLEGLPSGFCAFAGAGAEGTALLEVVHDIAPGAELSFANADTDVAFNQAVNFLAASNDVVTDDLGFYGEASDGTSAVSSNTAAALNNGANQIRAYVTANGNAADEHYYGSYADSGTDGTSLSGLTTTGHLHLFQRGGDTTDVLSLGPKPYNLISLPTNGEVAIFLTWDDAFGKSANNFDLFLVKQSNGQIVARSTDVQSGAQDPVEIVDYTNSGANDFFQIVVQNVHDQAQAKHLNLFSFSPECASDGPRLLANGHHERHNYNTATRSMSAQSDAGGTPVSVISAAAICSASAAAQGVFAGSAAPDESCTDRSNSTVEFFSSQGPTIDGRTKPDITGIDGVSVTAAGSFVSPFFGTSAAAPHVAGIAALALQAAPCLLSGKAGALGSDDARGKLRALLVNNAVRLGSGLPNNTFGYGRADAAASLAHAVPAFNGSASVTISGNSPSGADVNGGLLGFSDPNGCQIATLNWTGGCGTGPGSSLKCPFGASTVNVSASNNGVSFTDAHDVKITVTNFGVGASPASNTVPAGTAASYAVTVTAQGGAFTGPVTLGCANLPAQASCTFNPAIVTPGASSATAVLTIGTGTKASLVPTTLMRGHGVPAPRVSVRGGKASALVAAGTDAGGPGDRGPGLAPLVGVFALCGVLLTLARRSRPIAVAGLAAAVTLLVLLQACGGSSSSNGGSNGGGGGSIPLVTIAPGSLTFSSQGLGATSPAQIVTLTNGASSAMSIASVATTGDFAETNNCGASLAAAGSCAISVTFRPTAAGSRTGTLVVTDSGIGSPRSVALTGTGQAGPTAAGTYSINVTGTSGTLVQGGTVTLTVQ
jgi:hypothetical protein